MREPVRQTRLARLAVHHAFRFFIWYMRFLGVLRYELKGVEKLSRSGLLILANHPTLIDVVFLISLVPNADCVVKASLANNPFTRGPIRATRYLCNDSGPGLVQDCIASVKAGNNLIIFPEGTRTPVQGPMQLQRGAANIAVRGPGEFTPVIIRCEPLSLTKGSPWWKVPPRRMHFTIHVRTTSPCPPATWRRGTQPRPRVNSPPIYTTTSPGRARAMLELEHEIKRLVIETLNLEDLTPDDVLILPRRCSSRGWGSIPSMPWSSAWRCRSRTAWSWRATPRRTAATGDAALPALADFVSTHRKS